MSLIDKMINEVDCALRVCAGVATGSRTNPASSQPDVELTHAESSLSARLLRVNHCGEVCAQALYRGQALVAKDAATRDFLLNAAEEEIDHLQWCRERVVALGSKTSVLDPLFYFMSATMGTVTGLLGDKLSLGFVDETEQQVERHLDSHLDMLPQADLQSRAIVKQMKSDEAEHAANARAKGGEELPAILRSAMSVLGKVMTKTTHWV
jgi:3-demethoxyubiquinol 3-hydroxylase